MSFFSNAVRFIRKKDVKDSPSNVEFPDNVQRLRPNDSPEFDSFIRNYAKDAFSVLVVRPISNGMFKILRFCTSTITGVLIGAIVAIISCLIAMQFGTVENTVVSNFLVNKFEKVLPDTDMSIKSAMLRWNNDENSFEIDFSKVKFDNFLIPRVTITPDYKESLKQHKFVAKTVTFIKPKIVLDIADDFSITSVNPNLIKGGTNKVYFEPIENALAIKKALVGTNANTTVKLINADVLLMENNVKWNIKNLYCEYKLGENIPSVIDFSTVLPTQNYQSNVKVEKIADGRYNASVTSLNPVVIYNAFAKRKSAIDKFLPLIKGYNLPVSGTAKIALRADQSLDSCKFDFTASTGTIRLPNRNSLSLNLGKRIDNGTISGVIEPNKMTVNSMSVTYGNSGVQLTGISIPMSDFKFLDVANVDGTLSLSNVGMDDMYAMLPRNMSRSVVPVFRNYLPGFRLDLLKFDLKGVIAFGHRRNESKKLTIGEGIFRIHDAKIPLNNQLITNVDATGCIKPDGLDIKLSNAFFGKARINSGVFFISNQDASWIGKVNVDIPVENISTYASELSDKLATLPLDKLGIKGLAKVDMKVVRVIGDEEIEKSTLPFRMVEGDGIVASKDNTKVLKISWNERGVTAVADVASGKSSTYLKVTENFADNSGYGEMNCVGRSEFLATLMPKVTGIFSGDFKLKVNDVWDEKGEDIDLAVNLKDATMTVPVIGNVKAQKDNGKFGTHIHMYPDRVVLSKMFLDTDETKFSGQITMDNQMNVTECVLDNLVMDGIAAKVNILQKSGQKTILSLVGDSFDSNKLITLFNQAKKDITFVTYLNLKKLLLPNGNVLNNIKGTLDILDGRIVNGACIGVIGETTLALNTKDINNGADYLISLSASNAGDFLKVAGLGESVNGGTINFMIKSSKISEGTISGAFEMNDFLVKNNAQLTKLISLTSPNYLTGTDLLVGFNTCTGTMTISYDKVKIDCCKAVGPTIAVSMDGEYDRLNDFWNIAGVLLPMSSANNPSMNSKLVSNFTLTGPYWSPNLSVSASKFVPNDAVAELFGNLIPMLNIDYSEVEAEQTSSDGSNIMMPSPNENISDPYAQEAFDRIEQPKPAATANKKATAKKKRKKVVDNKFGVTIKRGLKNVD